MLVKDLINELLEFNPNANVVLPSSEEILLSYIGEDNTTKKTTKIVFIEGCDSCETCYYYEEEHDVTDAHGKVMVS